MAFRATTRVWPLGSERISLAFRVIALDRFLAPAAALLGTTECRG